MAEGYPPGHREAFLYLEEHPGVTREDFGARYRNTLEFYSGDFDKIMVKAGLPHTSSGDRDWGKLRTRLVNFLATNPTADIEAVRAARLGPTLKKFFDGDIGSAYKILCNGRRVDGADKKVGGGMGESVRREIINLGYTLMQNPDIPETYLDQSFPEAMVSLRARGLKPEDVVQACSQLKRDYSPKGNVNKALGVIFGRPLTEDELEDVEAAHIYVEQQPDATLDELAKNFPNVEAFYTRRINLLRRHIGLEERTSAIMVSEDGKEKRKSDLVDWLRRHPNAIITDITTAGHGAALDDFGGIKIAMAAAGIDHSADPMTRRLQGLDRPDTGKSGIGDDQRTSEVTAAPSIVVYEEIQRAFTYNPEKPDKMIGVSLPFRRMLERIKLAAESDADVLVYGETGSGKKLVARHIHTNGRRSKQPMVIYNCSKTKLGQQLMLSDLFGHVKGAFTGADSERIGHFAKAHGGDLVLEEISTLSPEAQAALLEYFDYRTITKVGATKEEHVDARVIAVTNEMLQRMAEEGEFREDLYYRLSGFEIDIPPLRERSEDIVPIASYLLDKHSKQMHRAVPRMTKAETERLRGYSWPGNTRQLENMMRESVILGELVVPNGQAPTTETITSLQAAEKAALLEAIKLAGGNKLVAARLTGTSKSAFYRKLAKHGIQ